VRFANPTSFKNANTDLVEDGHRYFGEMCLAQGWALALQRQRDDAERQHMIHCAHAARFHWTMLADLPSLARADHLLSHIHALHGDGDAALPYAESCMAFVTQGGKGFTPTHEAWAHESLARAFALLGDTTKRDEHLEAAHDAGIRIGEVGDLKLLFQVLSTIDGFELKYDVTLE